MIFPRETLLLAAGFSWLAFAAYPCVGCEPPPPPPPVIKPVDGDSELIPTPRIWFSKCTCAEVRTAWGLEPKLTRILKAHEQCEAFLKRRFQCSLPQ